ncbi:SIS domain-containing protein [Vibrio marisflavi]|uniref:HTH-type transcriptional regulator MurR n=1 Tax=Vibrio marisflavi CECT 7928 TaxID=634439 RepID=A0ABM9A1D3_9VIBR|nr:SIS domain-containing protein [Vibrio marisflavi]CAH0537365.1 HTH-type transcriptional regulator MurR [Vibrio marisflavi CECT 7928]
MATLTKIKTIKSTLSPSGLKIAESVLADPGLVVKLSSAELAKVAGVSQSAIIKFTQKVGCKGFTQFKVAISQELGRVQAQDIDSENHLHNHITSKDSLAEIADKLAQEKINAIRDTTSSIREAELQQAIELINNAHRVQIVGVGGSALVARDLAYKLLKIGITSIAEVDAHVQLTRAKALDSKDVQIVLSYSGKGSEVQLITQAAKDSNVPIVAITSIHKSPLRSLASICIDCIADESKWRSSSISSRAAQNVVIDLLFIALVQKRGKLAESLIKDASIAVQGLKRD